MCGLAEIAPIGQCPVGSIRVVENFAAGETARNIVVGFVAGLLKIDECCGNRDEPGLQGLAIQSGEKFRRYAAAGELLRDLPHVAVGIGAGQTVAESVPVAAGNHEPRCFGDQHVKNGVIGRGDRPAQAGLPGPLPLLSGEIPRLGQEIGMKAHPVYTISEAPRKRT